MGGLSFDRLRGMSLGVGPGRCARRVMSCGSGGRATRYEEFAVVYGGEAVLRAITL